MSVLSKMKISQPDEQEIWEQVGGAASPVTVELSIVAEEPVSEPAAEEPVSEPAAEADPAVSSEPAVAQDASDDAPVVEAQEPVPEPTAEADPAVSSEPAAAQDASDEAPVAEAQETVDTPIETPMDPFGDAEEKAVAADAEAEDIPRVEIDDPLEVMNEDHASLVAGAGVVECGDPVIDIPNPPSPAQEMMARGFPQRPKFWPMIMAWPMQPEFDMMAAARADEEALAEYRKLIDERIARMMRRAEQIDEFILKNNPPEKIGRMWDQTGVLPRARAKRHLRESDGQTYRGVMWASLLDDDATRQAATVVRRWSHHVAVTTDGGSVYAKKDALRVPRPTRQALELTVKEAQARGWNHLKLTGNKEFAMHAIEVAKAMNVSAEIFEYYGFLGLMKKRHVVMPTPPELDGQLPEVVSERISPSPGTQAAADLDAYENSEAGEQLTADEKQAAIRGLSLMKGETPKPERKNDVDLVDEVVAEQEARDIEWDEGVSPAPQ